MEQKAEQQFFLTMTDQAEVFIRHWSQVDIPVGVLQIAHGMAEHGARYEAFALACNDQGFIVVANDHRGHGQTGEKAGLMGYFAEQNGFDRVVDDLNEVTNWINQEYPELPVFILGHSMGSFLTRRYIQKYGENLQGAIIMGSGGDPGLAGKIGKMIARWQMRKEPTKPSPFLDKLSFGSFNQAIPAPLTNFDWLSRDTKAVEKYLADPHCGFICSSGFFYDLLTGLGLIHNPQLINQIPRSLPLLIVSGDADPVGKNGKGIHQFVEQYKTAGLTDIEVILYPGARHELINETNRIEVIADICLWLQKQLSKP